MNLTGLITSFKTKTGRLDLTDSEITTYLNDACSLLDRLENSGKRHYRYSIDVSAGTYIVGLPASVRVVGSCVVHTDDGVTNLSFVDPNVLLGVIRSGEQTSAIYQNTFSVIQVGLISDLLLASIPTFKDTVDPPTDIVDRNHYLLVYPQVEGIIEIEHNGYTPGLSSTSLTNYWSVSNPVLVIQAVQYLLIKDLLNIDESTKIYQDLQNSVKPITFDYYEQECITQMEG